jgi:hypothetical protein
MNLEHCRKDAKRLLRAVAARDADALARVREILGERAGERLGLSDAQHVVANERGYRSWPALTREAARGSSLQPARPERWVDTGLSYGPGDPVRVWVRHREQRLSVSERGTALEKAGAPRDWRRGCARVHAELVVNITRSGVIWLPIVAAGPSRPEVEQRIGRASLIFFQELLELDQR